jgi:hypothetical protein
MDDAADPSPHPDAPLLRIVSPDATPEEVAAVVVAVRALASAGSPPPVRRRPEWSSPQRAVRAALPSGPGGWRASALPR